MISTTLRQVALNLPRLTLEEGLVDGPSVLLGDKHIE